MYMCIVHANLKAESSCFDKICANEVTKHYGITLLIYLRQLTCIYILQLVCSKMDHHAMMLSLVQLVVHWSCHLLE